MFTVDTPLFVWLLTADATFPNWYSAEEHPRYALGLACEHGSLAGCARDDAAALSHYKSAAMLGHASAQ